MASPELWRPMRGREERIVIIMARSAGVPRRGGRIIRIYGRFDKIADSQERFSQWIRSLPLS
jgi:hypothetical protein